MFMKVNLQTRLFLAFLAPSALALLAVLNSLFTEQRLGQYNRQLSDNNLPSLDGLWRIKEGQTQIDAAENELLQHTLSPTARAVALADIQKAWRQIDSGFAQALYIPPHNQQGAQLEQQFRQDWEIWKQADLDFLAQEREFAKFQIADPEQYQSNQLLRGQRNPMAGETVNAAIAARSNLVERDRQKQVLLDQSTESLRKLLRYNQEFAAEIKNNSAQTIKTAQTLGMLVLLIVPLIVSLLAWVLSRRIARPIDQQLGTLIQDLELARDQLEAKVVERTQAL